MSRKPVISRALDLHDAENGVFVYEASANRVHNLNHTAATILRLCDGTRDMGQIAAAVGALFDLDEPPILRTKACLNDLFRDGLMA